MNIEHEKIYCKGLTQKEYNREYRRTRAGLVKSIYSGQKTNSKRRNHVAPNYSFKELLGWVLAQSNFEQLYCDWGDSDFAKMQVPSCDRLDDCKPYTLDNLQLTTWEKNKARYHVDCKKGINKKMSRGVVQMTKTGLFIAEHYSMRHAARKTGVNNGNISNCCNGRQKSIGGFRWMRSLGIPIYNNQSKLGEIA